MQVIQHSELQPLTRDSLARALGKQPPIDPHHASTTAGGVISNPETEVNVEDDGFKPVLENRARCWPFGCVADISKYIWLFNAFCFAAHLTWMIMCLRSAHGKEDKMAVTIYRTHGSWNSTGANGYVYELVDNGMPVRIDVICALFFGLSAFFHGAITILSPFQFSRRFYWKNLDRAFVWWRWLEYSLSASVMMLGICLLTGLREQNALASVFILCWATMLTGFYTELYSIPVEDRESWVGDFAVLGRNARVQRQLNYVRRMLPAIFGIFLYCGMWVIVLHNFLQQLDDLKERDYDLYKKVPAFVPWVVVGSAVIFSLFTIPLVVFQWRKPKFYYQTEFWYCLLSLTAKSYLGGLLYAFVLRAGSFEEAVSLD